MGNCIMQSFGNHLGMCAILDELQITGQFIPKLSDTSYYFYIKTGFYNNTGFSQSFKMLYNYICV